MAKFLSILLLGCLTLFSSLSFAQVQNPPKIRPSNKPVSEKQKLVPNQILVKFKSPPEASYQREISLPIPFSRNRIVLRQAGLAVKDMSGVTKLNKKLKVKSIQKLGQTGSIQKMAKIRFPEEVDIFQAIDNYSQDQDVVYAEPNYIYHALWTPNDPYFSADPLNHYQWNLDRINMREAWDFVPQGGSGGIKVAVIDTGVAFENYNDGQNQFTQAPELNGVSFDSPKHFSSIESCDFLCLTCQSGDQTITDHPNDDSGHGTHVTGTIAQLTNNDNHAAGIAFETTIMPIKVLNDCGMGETVDIVAGINWAVSHGARVINLSLGSTENSVLMHEEIIEAVNQGVVVVAAAGNEASRNSSPAVIYPAAYPETIAAGASRWDNRRSEYSNYGPELDLIAPGGQTNSEEGEDPYLDQNGDLLPDGIVQQTFLPDDFSSFTEIGEPGEFGYRCVIRELIIFTKIDEACGLHAGTSMATPHVAAAAALILSLNPSLGPAEVKSILTSTASKSLIPDYNENEHGAGLLDVAAALNQAGSTPTFTPSPISSPTLTPISSPTPTPTPILTSTLTPTPSSTPPSSPTPSPSFAKGDVNHDSQVNNLDIRIVLQYYLRQSWPESIWPDPSSDGIINGLDLGWVARDWGSD